VGYKTKGLNGEMGREGDREMKRNSSE